MTDTSVSVRTEAEEEGTTAIRVDTHLRHGVTIWADGEVDHVGATVTITAPDVDGHGRMTILADTPQLREALRALVRVWDAKVLTERPACEVRVRGCEGRSVDVHEPRTRARGGSHLDESNTLAVCRSCHEWIHHFPGEATRLRFLIHSWDPS